MALIAIQQLEDLDATSGPIRVFLNSEGGEEPAGYALHDAIKMCRNHVTIEGYGSVWSIAAAVFQAGDRRLLAPNSLLMVHNGFTGEKLKRQDEVLVEAERLRRHNTRYYKILSDASGQPVDRVKAWCRRETYFLAGEAVAAGFADEIIKPFKGAKRKDK